MSDQQQQKSGRHGLLRLLVPVVILAVIGLAVYPLLTGDGNDQIETASSGGNAAIKAAPDGISRKLSTGALAAFVIHKTRKEIKPVTFMDKQGKKRSLSDWKGRVVLVNLWATWCAPCRREMPHLDKLQSTLGGDDFEVVAISVDRKGLKASARFLADTNASHLALYVDKTVAALRALGAIGLPATVLVDRHGKEIGRMMGPADWSSKEALRLITTAIAEK